MKHLQIPMLFLAAACSLAASAQMPTADAQSARAVESMNKMVGRFHAFLSKPQRLVYRQKSAESPSRAIYVVREITTKEVSSEMKNNDSQTVPFTGYIQFTLRTVSDSVKCGALELKSPAIRASASSADAVSAADKPECFVPAAGVAVPLVLHVNFAYQRGKWVPKSVTRSDDKRDAVFTATLLDSALDDIEVVDAAEGVKFNSGWKELLVGNS